MREAVKDRPALMRALEKLEVDELEALAECALIRVSAKFSHPDPRFYSANRVVRKLWDEQKEREQNVDTDQRQGAAV